jgi:hypothetical protein
VARLAVLKFVHYMNASADVLALASVEVPINNIPEGGCIVIKYVAPSLSLPALCRSSLGDTRTIYISQSAFFFPFKPLDFFFAFEGRYSSGISACAVMLCRESAALQQRQGI